MVSSIDVPGWAAQPTLFVALRPRGSDFGFRGDVICTSKGTEYPIEDYRDSVREFTVEHSTARHAALESGETYMVGSLARLRLWGDRLGWCRKAVPRRALPARCDGQRTPEHTCSTGGNRVLRGVGNSIL